MTKPIKTILIAGGGSAGWITAGLLAARHSRPDGSGVKIRLVESPDIPIIGVGEGTWPTMRSTLHKIGLDESEFLTACHASFKQGSKFVGWRSGAADDQYYHPFDLPQGFSESDIASYWLTHGGEETFSRAVCAQEHLCELNLAPKLITSRAYAGVANYGYHLDAGLFSSIVKDHCTSRLGVELIRDNITDIETLENGDIRALNTMKSGPLEADLFIDCTGMRSLLLGQHFGVGLVDQSDAFPVDHALAVQVPHKDGDEIRSQTTSTAQSAGWIWDIGLSNRRGVGHVFSSRHISEDIAHEELRAYLGVTPSEYENLSVRKLAISPGYRETFWANNCLAIGLSAGFLEPLEASALKLIEKSAGLLSDHMPTTRESMTGVARNYNARMSYMWARIIDFLKLHYVLSERTEPFWKDAADPSTMSDRLAGDLEMWRYQPPRRGEFASADEVFPIASYQYVLFGMGAVSQPPQLGLSEPEQQFGAAQFETVRRNVSVLSERLDTNRAFLDRLKAAQVAAQ